MSDTGKHRKSPYKVLLDLLLAALPADDEVLAVNMDAIAGFSPAQDGVDAHAVTVRAVTLGLLDNEQRQRFHQWPNRPLMKHWVGALEEPGKLRVALHSIASPSGA